MTEPLDPPPAVAPRVLLYRSPTKEARQVSSPLVWATAVGTGGLLFGAVYLSAVAGFRVGRPWPALLIPALLIVLTFAALRLQRGRGQSLALGIWIGIGLGLLAEGICFGIMATQ